MIAIVKQVNPTRVMVRRNYRLEAIDQPTKEAEEYVDKLKIGDRVEVKRQVNNPYLILVNNK